MEHFHLQGGSRPPGRLRQFFHGLSLPFHLARALLRDPVARRLYLRVGLLQTVAALALALTCMGSGKKAAEGVRQQESREEASAQAKALRKTAANLADQHLRKAEARAARRILEGGAASGVPDEETASKHDGEETKARKAPPPDTVVAVAPPPEAAVAAALTPEAEEAPAPRPEAAMAAAPVPEDAGAMTPGGDAAEARTGDATRREGAASSRADAGAKKVRSRAEARAEAKARLEQRVQDLEAAAQGFDGGTSLAEAIAALAIEAASSTDDADSDTEDADSDTDEKTDEAALAAEDGGTPAVAQGSTPRDGDGDSRGRIRVQIGGEDSFWNLAFWVALFTLLQVFQWVVIALSRDYHDVIAREASLLTGVKPEDDVIIPAIRLDVPWIRKKVRRRWRAFKLFLAGVPALVLLAVPFLCLTSTVFTVLSTAWGAWWWVVFTAAKSEHAWVEPAQPHTPWFLRVWSWLTTQMPGLRWGILQRYGARWARRTDEVLAPVAAVERHPWAFAGLTLVRFVGAFPPLKFFVRPLIPVASAHLLAAEAAARASASPPAPRPHVPEGEAGA